MNNKFKQSPSVRKTVQSLRALYVPTPSFRDLDNLFDELIEQRRADIADGVSHKTRGLILVGQSGSGKTTAVRELIRKYSKVIQTDTSQETCEYIGLQVPSPATMKFVGAATLRALGYPYAGDKQGPAIWDQVKVQLKLRGTLFLGLDEAQDLARYQTDKERQSVVNTLKSLMENSVWETGLILSGMPDLKKIVNQDEQLGRRLLPVEISRLHAINDIEPVVDIVQQYARRAKVRVSSSVRMEHFAKRLMHAADYQFGLMAEITVQSVTKALFSKGFDAEISIEHFADVYRDRNASVNALNPFIAEDYARINPRVIFDDDPYLEDDE